MKYRILFLAILFTIGTVYGSDSLQITFIQKTFVKGDTIEFRCVLPNYAAMKLSMATLNVWIEDLEKHRRWKYRYPILNGEVIASLAVSDKIPDGKYAVNFLVQRGLFRITGEIAEHSKSDSVISYIMVSKNKKDSYFDYAHVAGDGSFRLKSTLFPDSAFFIFSPHKKVKDNYLNIKVETPLDSAFTPVLQETDFITIGDAKMLGAKKTDTSAYGFRIDDLSDAGMLPGVTVTAKFKKKIEQYDEEYSSGLFKRNDAIIFDGIESEDIARSISILNFLQVRVPGLTVSRNEEGEEVAKWRKETVEIYIDEFRMSPSENIFVSPADVAMIKVYRPPAMISSGSAGAIAIYTKKGSYADNSKARHNFVVKGYTNLDSTWE